MSLLTLVQQIKRVRRRIPLVVADETNKLAVKVAATAAINTPVDTSKALSNWQIGLGSPPSLEIEAHFEGVAQSTLVPSFQATVSKAELKLIGRKVGTVINVTNNASYIEDLNNGTISLQPGGFAEKAEAEGRRLINQIKIDRL